jgi:hypothetical protein
MTMWFNNKIANPVVRLILRSRFHRWMSASVLLITYRGRKSGKEFTLPVQYAEDDHFIFIVPGMPERKSWWRNFRESTPVRLTLRGEVVSSTGILLDTATQMEEIVTGIEVYFRGFPAYAKNYHIRTVPSGGWDTEDLHRAAISGVMIRVDLKKPENPA